MIQFKRGILGLTHALVVFGLAAVQAQEPASSWSSYGGAGGQQYSALQEITAANLHQLELAWSYRSGELGEDFTDRSFSLQANPLVWNGTIYFSTATGFAIAVDAQTGKERWRYHAPIPKDSGYSESASRGISLWHGESGECPDRVFLGTRTGQLHAINATTGEACADFGSSGFVDLSLDVGSEDIGDYGITSPPAIINDSVIVGSAIGDNRAVKTELGIVRALDARSGKVLWQWDPIPRSDAAAPDGSLQGHWGAGSATRTGSANAWAPLSADPELGLVFVPTSSPSPDFYGGDRPGDNRYANSLVALDAETGAVAWHQQLVHHDVWDYDTPMQPTLTRLEIGGVDHAAVMLVGKTGMLYAFDRATGKALIELEERPVPKSTIAGETLSPTQPFSALPPLVSHEALDADDAFGLLWFDKRACRKVLESYRSEGIFTPPTLTGSIQYPGYAGGANWGGVAVDPNRQIAVTNVMQLPGLIRLIPRAEVAASRASGELDGWSLAEQRGTPYAMARRIFLSPLGMPCIEPPWGKLVAVDLRAQKILWDVPLGTIEDLAPAPVPNFAWGVPNLGGAVVTASGLVIIGSAADFYLRIFDLMTGKELWQARLPTSANSTPATFSVAGTQYIVAAVGGHSELGSPRGDYLMAWRLSD